MVLCGECRIKFIQPGTPAIPSTRKRCVAPSAKYAGNITQTAARESTKELWMGSIDYMNPSVRPARYGRDTRQECGFAALGRRKFPPLEKGEARNGAPSLELKVALRK